ncbi:MAG: argininosuccinate synthase [Gemmatimonadota bacterium]
MRQPIKSVALAYSGGLDTSVAVAWLVEEYGAEVHCVAVDVGQGSQELEGLEERALSAGAASCRLIDARQEFVSEFVWPTLMSGAVYGRKYLLGTAMARPLIAREVIRAAAEVGADAVAHGCTGKGNDQVRFELTFAWFAPHLRVIAPWREWSIRGRADAERYALQRGVPLPPKKTSQYSRDRNAWHVSHEGGPLEDPSLAPDPDLFMLTADPETSPAQAEEIVIGFDSGRPCSLDGRPYSPLELLQRLNAVAGRHGIGRVDVIEDRIVGLKSRGIYETPGGTLLHTAHSELEQLVLDQNTLELKDELAPRYGRLVYEGRWWGTEREALDAFIRTTQSLVTGSVRLRLCRGNISVAGREARSGLYREEYATFEASDLYDHADASGFIRLKSLPYRIRGGNSAGASVPLRRSGTTGN